MMYPQRPHSPFASRSAIPIDVHTRTDTTNPPEPDCDFFWGAGCHLDLDWTEEMKEQR